MTRREAKFEGRGRQRNSGQIVVEYVLLLVVSVAIAALITSQMVSRSADTPGFLTAKWQQILVFIGGDTADDITN